LSALDGSVYNSYEMPNFSISSCFPEESTVYLGGSVLTKPVLAIVSAFY